MVWGKSWLIGLLFEEESEDETFTKIPVSTYPPISTNFYAAIFSAVLTEGKSTDFKILISP